MLPCSWAAVRGPVKQGWGQGPLISSRRPRESLHGCRNCLRQLPFARLRSSAYGTCLTATLLRPLCAVRSLLPVSLRVGSPARWLRMRVCHGSTHALQCPHPVSPRTHSSGMWLWRPRRRWQWQQQVLYVGGTTGFTSPNRTMPHTGRSRAAEFTGGPLPRMPACLDVVHR